MDKLKFTEKYRPNTLKEVKGNKQIIRCLESFDINDLPNMLFYGPPGTGKTTAIKALIYKKIKAFNVLELNASDERGIDIVRHVIKHFAETSTEHRLVILDEVDSMSRDAQGALRRIMEDFPNCRFCLICNYARKIIEPIQSRCAKFRFKPLDLQYVKSFVDNILQKENIKIKDDKGISLLIDHADGDLRKLVVDLQGIQNSFEFISEQNISEFLGLCDTKIMQEIFEMSIDKDVSFKQLFDYCISKNIECGNLLSFLFNKILLSGHKNRFKIMYELGNIEMALSIGCNETIQLSAIVGAFKKFNV
ncbi:Rfc5 [Ecytonucleospora hepatopenaei]|uniref:Rfc5 n=1 Tax=Ecytonucleospora hepatopenaei TaxID=646526 RepID=A0A1W0E3R8_9MICR|nr:Rfc5 [Ecytonucleospora hepatopenaei]